MTTTDGFQRAECNAVFEDHCFYGYENIYPLAYSAFQKLRLRIPLFKLSSESEVFVLLLLLQNAFAADTTVPVRSRIYYKRSHSSDMSKVFVEKCLRMFRASLAFQRHTS